MTRKQRATSVRDSLSTVGMESTVLCPGSTALYTIKEVLAELKGSESVDLEVDNSSARSKIIYAKMVHVNETHAKMIDM